MASLDSTTKPSLGRLWGGVYGRRTKFSAGTRDGHRERPIASALFSLYPPWTFPGRPASPPRHQERRPAQGSGQGLSSFAHLDRKTGEVVTREEIRVRLWPEDTHVDDENVNTTVNRLRQALGDSPHQPLYIETIPRKGYCLVIAAEFADSPLPRAEAQGAPPNGSVNGGKTTLVPVKSGLWITLGVVGLILAGMLLGAVITKVWIMHFAMP